MNADCPHTGDAGAWALNALDPSEVDRFEAHLAGCSICRHEVAALRMAVDTLPLAAPQTPPPPALKQRLMAIVESEAQLLRAAGPDADRTPAPRRRRRWSIPSVRPLPALAVGCALLAVGLGLGVALRDADSERRTVAIASAPSGATVKLTVSDARASLDLRGMPAPPRGRVYQVWLKRGDAAPRPTHTLFTVRPDGRARVTVDEPVGKDDRLIVTDEPPSGSRAPTGNQAIVAQPA